MPIYKNPDHCGDLYVILEIEMPEEQWLQSIDHEARFTLQRLLIVLTFIYCTGFGRPFATQKDRC